MIEDRKSAPKADALPGCATPRPSAPPSFPRVFAQAESDSGAFRGGRWQNVAGTGETSPGIFPNLSGPADATCAIATERFLPNTTYARQNRAKPPFQET